jgi:hypothetical protein
MADAARPDHHRKHDRLTQSGDRGGRATSGDHHHHRSPATCLVINTPRDAEPGEHRPSPTPGARFALERPDDLPGDWQLWIYECTQPNTLTNPDNANDANDSNTGNSATPPGSGLFNSNFFGTNHIYFATLAVGGNGGVATGADSPWILDTVIDGNATAYLDDSTGDLTVGFKTFCRNA